MSTDEPTTLEDIDPAVMAEIEAEFNSIATEIQRISALPASQAPKKPAMLASLREEWRKKAEARDPNRPEWRKSLDMALDQAIEKLVADSIIETPDGQVAFEMNNATFQSEAPPVMKALMNGVVQMLQEKLKPAPGAAPSPWAPLLQSMAVMLGKALSTMEAPKVEPPKAAAAEAKDGPPPEPRVKDPDAPLGGEGIQFELNVPLEAKVQLSQKSEPAPAPTEVNPAGQEFFANLMQGLGHMLQNSFKAPAKADETKTEGAEKKDEKQEPATTVTAELKQDGPPPPEGSAKPTVKIDVQGLLGQLLKGLTQPKK